MCIRRFGLAVALVLLVGLGGPGAQAPARVGDATERPSSAAADVPSLAGRWVLQVEYTRRVGGWLEVSDLDGANRRVLTAPPRKGVARRDLEPVWSPDASMVAFVRVRSSGRGRSGIFVVNADGSGLRRVVGSEAVGGGLGGVVWSRDGTRLAFTRDAKCFGQRERDVGLYVVNADGTGVRKLPVLSPYVSSLRLHPVGVTVDGWSADGTTLLYHVVRFSGGECRTSFQESSDLYSIRADGGAATLLASTDWIDRARWSPDERSIAFSAYGDNQMGDSCSLFLRDADGTVITLVQADYVLFGCPSGGLSFVWSNDGGEIAYSSEGANVDAIDPQTGQRRRVFAGTPSPPCNETGDVSEQGAPCSIHILALARDGSRILVDQDPYGLRDMPLMLASFDGTSSLTLPSPAAGRPGKRVAAVSAELP